MDILLADDSPDTCELVKTALGRQYRITCLPTRAQALEALTERRFDLVLLDVSLPDGDGFQICARLRSLDVTKEIPVIFLTGKTGVANRITGYSVGADDYIEKPFDPAELSLRVKAKMARTRRGETAGGWVHAGRLKLNAVRQAVTVAEAAVELTPLEFKMILYFVRNQERVVSRQQLLDAVWGQAIFIVDRTVDKHICGLRKKLRECGSYVQTVQGFGYRFSAQKGGTYVVDSTD